MSEIQNVIVCFAGRKGSGKSTALRRVLEHCPRFFLFDINGEHGWIPNRFGRMADVEQFLAWGETQKCFAGSYLPSRDMPAFFAQLCNLVYAHGRLTFAVEEAPEVCSAASLPDAFSVCIRRGRHRRLNLAWTCQRLAETSITLRSQTDYFVIGSQAEPRDLDALAERCGREAAEKAAGLGLHGFLVWDVVNRQEVPLEAVRAALAGVPDGSRVLAGAGSRAGQV
ncbi:MAG: hypothetical protein LAN84_12180 [Acidobacteriia bacterium]|nr:hypothetical protein [Terriglobia bacterium]